MEGDEPFENFVLITIFARGDIKYMVPSLNGSETAVGYLQRRGHGL